MAVRISSLTQGTAEQTGEFPIVQDGETKKLTAPTHSLKPKATAAEVRQGTENDKVVTPAPMHAYIDPLYTDATHSWRDWSALSVHQSGTYGTTLITGLATYSNAVGATKLTPSALPTGTALYDDAALVYNNGFADGIALPTAPPSDVWRVALVVKTDAGSLWLQVRWQLAGVLTYESANAVTPDWVQVNNSSETLGQHQFEVGAGTGWHIMASDATNLPPIGNNGDLVGIPWAMKRQGDTVYAVGLGYVSSANGVYRMVTASRRQAGIGSSAGNAVTTVGSNGDIPSSPSVGDIIFVTTTFSSYQGNTFYRWTGTIWQAMSTLGSGGGGHPHEVSVGGIAPSGWAVRDWVYNVAENNVTMTRGSASATLSPKTIYIISAIGTNSLTMSVLRLRMNEMPSGDINIGRIFPTTAAAGTVPVSNGSGGGTYSHIGLAELDLNATEKGGSRILHTNAAGTQITSSPHTDLDIGADQIISGKVPQARLNGFPYVVASTSAELNAAISGMGSTDPFIVHNRASYSWVAPGESGGVSMVAGQTIFRSTGVGGSDHILLKVAASEVTGTLAATNIPTLPIGTKTNGDLPASRVDGRLALSNMPENLVSGIGETTNLNTQLGSEGVYRFEQYAQNSPVIEAPGILYAEHNDQTVIITGNRLDGTGSSNTAGRIYTRAREFTYGGITGVSDLTNGTLGFTQLTNSSNFNDLANGYAFWFGGSQLGDNSTPTNAPGWASGLIQASRVGTVVTTANGQIALVGGGAGGNNNIKVWVRLRSGATWDSVWYDSKADLDLRLPRVGVGIITSLHQLRSDTQASDLKLWIPSGVTAEHPRAVDGSDVASSGEPIWVSRYALSGTDTIRFVWNHGGLTGAGNAVQLAVRTTTETITNSSPSAWSLVDDNAVASGTYSSTNGTITLTKEDATTVTITGLPYVTSS